MDPQETPANQPAPEVPTLTTPPVAPAPTPTAPTPVAAMPGAKKSSKKTLFGIIAAVVVVLIVLVAAWFMYLSPSAQSKRLSNKFMHSITTNDVAKATDLTGDSTAKAFLTTASKSVHGSYSLSQSKFTDGKGYYLYTLSGADKKYARTIVEKDSGKRVVSSFVYSNSTLALVPGTSSASTSDSTKTSDSGTEKSTTTPSKTAGCLVASDFSFFANVSMDSPDPNADGTFTAFFQLLFNPDVATYASDDIPDPTTVFNDFKAFYAQNADKKYLIQLESSVNSATPDVPLANARNAQVQSDLEKISGIPASRITLMPVGNDTSTDGNTSGDSFYRQVQITLVSDPSCSSLSQD